MFNLDNTKTKDVKETAAQLSRVFSGSVRLFSYSKPYHCLKNLKTEN